MPDFTTLSESDLEAYLNAILNEQERRKNLANIPGQIAELKLKFVDGGGDPALIS